MLVVHCQKCCQCRAPAKFEQLVAVTWGRKRSNKLDVAFEHSYPVFRIIINLPFPSTMCRYEWSSECKLRTRVWAMW
jgi:hypothetical protein